MKFEVNHPNLEIPPLDNEKIREMMENNHQPKPPKYEDTFFKIWLMILSNSNKTLKPNSTILFRKTKNPKNHQK